MLRPKYTKKLHYGKYVYKICIKNELASSFRGEFNRAKGDQKFPLAASVFDQLEILDVAGKAMTYGFWAKTITKLDLNYAKDLYSILTTHDDYKIRIDRGVYMWLYTNTRSLLDDVINLGNYAVKDLWDVAEEDKVFLLANQNCVLVDSPPDYDYKIYLKSQGDPAKIVNWCADNLDKIRIGEQCLKNLRAGWVNGNYFFVRDEQVLMLVRIMIGDSITRVEKQIYLDDLDKYTYESK